MVLVFSKCPVVICTERGVFSSFTHFAALTAEELSKVEALVNLHILAANAIDTVETDIETARQSGAMALFGEKYGKVVEALSASGRMAHSFSKAVPRSVPLP